MTGRTGGLCALEELMLKEEDLQIFPPNIVALFKRGRLGPLRAHATMKGVAKLETNVERKGRQIHWLGQPRLWTAWGGLAPGLWRLKGFGTTAMGKEHYQPDGGTFVLTQYITLLFIPVWAINSFLVTKADDGWQFHGLTPLSSAGHTTRKVAGVVVALGVLWRIGFAINETL